MAKQQNSSRNRHWGRRLVWGTLGATAVGAFGYAVWPQPMNVEVAPAQRRTLVVTVEEDGKARVKDRFVVSAPLTGNLTRIELQVGESIKPGTVVARLVPLPSPLLDQRARSQSEAQVAVARASSQQADAEIERARVAVDSSRVEADRARALFQRGSLTRAELERAELEERARRAEFNSAEFGARVATHRLRQANAALGHYSAAKSNDTMLVTSPIEGQVLAVLQQSEGIVQGGAPLVELGDPRALEVVADVLTRDAVLVKPQAPSEIVEWGGPPLLGQVRLVEPSAFTRRSALGVEEQRVNVVVDLTSPYEMWSKLGDGYRTTVRIETHRAENVVTVPQSALFRSNAAWAAYVVRDGAARLQLLEVGYRDKTHAEVTQGLSEGDQVIVHPNPQLAEGVKVAPR